MCVRVCVCVRCGTVGERSGHRCQCGSGSVLMAAVPTSENQWEQTDATGTTVCVCVCVCV